MKIKFLLLATISVALLSCTTVNKTCSVCEAGIISYNFETKNYECSMLKPKVRKPLFFRITNINRLAYDAKITSADVAIADEYFNQNIEQTLEKSSLKEPISEPIVQKLISETVVTETNDQSKNNIKNDISKENSDVSRINGDIIKLKSDLNSDKIKMVELLQNQSKYTPSTDAQVVTKNEADIASLEAAIYTKHLQLQSLENDLKTKQQEIINKVKTTEAIHLTFNQFNQRYTEIVNKAHKIKQIDDIYQSYYQLALNPLLRLTTYQKLADDKKFILYQLIDYRLQLEDFEKSVSDFSNFYNGALNNWSLFEDIKIVETKENVRAKYKLYNDEVDKIKLSISALNLKTKLRKVEALHSILSDSKAYEMTSSSIQPLEDYVTFDVKIKHRDANKAFEFDDNREFTYMEYTRGGIRFDFSTGVVLNFIGNNDGYGLENVTVNPGETPMKRIVVVDNNQFTPTLAGMFHTSFRTSGIFSFGLTLGASINVETFELSSLFPGVSLMIGKKQKFIISAGPAFRQIQELKANYIENGIYDAAALPDNTVLTSKQFRVGAFVGLTYNLTQKQRAKYKIGSN